MSYAIESKKRKFERILETLTDSTSSSSRVPVNSVTNVSTTSISTGSASDSSKRRRILPTSMVSRSSTSTTSTTSMTTQYLPSSRAAFLQRLETFRNVTRWHVPSTSAVNAAEWARRGWICKGGDTVSCPSCEESVFVDLEVRNHTTIDDQSDHDKEKQDEDEGILDIEEAFYEGLVKRYSDMIVTAHGGDCPWRRRGCDSSIQRIEGLLNVSNALSLLRSRYEHIDKTANDIPMVASLPSVGTRNVGEQKLQSLELPGHELLHINTLKLAVCGWQGKEADVVECRNCFRSLGLWLYRGDNPTMDQLDAIDSHLEYCPWRSAHAQDAEIMSTRIDTAGKEQVKERLPGWLLTYDAITKDNVKRAANQPRSTVPAMNLPDESISQVELTPEQREKKMKDMRQRIRDLKKPFNFKSLLRRKDKPAV